MGDAGVDSSPRLERAAVFPLWALWGGNHMLAFLLPDEVEARFAFGGVYVIDPMVLCVLHLGAL